MEEVKEKEEYSNVYVNSLIDLDATNETVHMFIYSSFAFFIPFFLGHPQILVGSIVNAALILGSIYLKGYKLLPVILLPSVGVFLAGVIFGPSTMFLLYLIPFIWVGNALYSYGYRFLSFRKMNPVVSIILTSAVKALFLFGSAYLLFSLKLIPAVFLTAMGLFQAITALIGGFSAVAIAKFIIKGKAVQKANN